MAGYSTKINDPAFEKYLKNANRWALIFSIILALIAVVGFFIYGEYGSDMDNPQALYIGLGIGCMFIIIALFTIVGKKKSKTWDGQVSDKKVEKKRKRKYTDNSDYYWEEYLLYTVFIRDESGKTHELSARNDDTTFNYYKVGDKVRHHAGLNTYEKHDKTGDEILFCNVCASLNDIKNDFCFRCKCPLLK